MSAASAASDSTASMIPYSAVGVEIGVLDCLDTLVDVNVEDWNAYDEEAARTRHNAAMQFHTLIGTILLALLLVDFMLVLAIVPQSVNNGWSVLCNQ